jgi:thiamine-monophosphate kinase
MSSVDDFPADEFCLGDLGERTILDRILRRRYADTPGFGDDCAAAHGTRVVGGDLRDGVTMQLSATAIGRCAPGTRLSRSGAEPGDRLLLIGSPGYLWASALLAGVRATIPDAIWSRACKPTAQLTAGRILAEHGVVQAAMDVSDGLYATVRTLCDANGIGATIDPDIHLDPPLASVCAQSGVTEFELAQTWGDWTLVVAVRPEDLATAVKLLTAEAIPVREIGTFTAAAGLNLRADGKTVPWQGIAQERFSASSWHGGELSDLITEVLGVPAT